MPQQTINLGTTPSDGTGDNLRTALDKVNDNFTEVYQLVGDAAPQSELDDHVEDTNNPHSVTKIQVGLGNVDNTSDAAKPISAATQEALNAKLDANHASVTNARTPTGGAGGVLSGTYPNPGFAVDMATQAELDAVALAKADVSHSHSNASTGTAGFMSASDKSKLDGIAANANNYVLPTPTTTVMGGVKRNAGSAGQFVNGIDASGNLTYGTPGGGSTITTPRVLYVETTGNNGTAVVGDPSKPYATAQAAFDAALALSGNYLLKLGVGSFSVTTSEVWPSRLAVSGAGRKHSLLTLTTSDNVVMCSDMTVDVTIDATGDTGSVGSTGSTPGGTGGTGGTGDTGPYIELHGVYGRVTTVGGDGGTGGNGGDGDGGTIGGIGGDGGTGGTGGAVVAVDCALEYLNSYGGAGGNGGDGGMDGGAGGGGLGNSGASGAGGTVSFYHSRVGELNCDTYNFGLSSLGSANLSSLGSDYGATSSFTWLNIT